MQNKSLPLVSVCIPLYNASEWIEETITRLQNQTYHSLEIVIVDDSSSDNSLDIARRFETDSIHVYSNPRKGGNVARNYAFEKSHGEYIKFIDADDYMDDDTIEKQLTRLLIEEHPEDCIVTSPLYFALPDGSIEDLDWRHIDKDYCPGIELLVDIWKGNGYNCPHCHLMHRSLVEKSGGWNESIIKNQDGEFFGRLYTLASKIISVTNTRIFWRRTFCGVSENLSKEANQSVLQSYIILSTYLLKYRNDQDMRDIISKYISSAIWEYNMDADTVALAMDDFCKNNLVKFHVPHRSKIRYLEPILGFKKCLTIRNKKRQ